MKKMFCVFFIALAVVLPAWADNGASPLAEQDAATEPPVSSTPSYYTLAEVWAYEWGRPDAPLKGADLFLDGRLVGKSPFVFKTQMIDKNLYELTARMPGYREGLRPAVKIPPEGRVMVALLPENPDQWFTLPSFIVGVGLVAGGLVAANAGTGSSSTALIASGAGLMGLAYTISWIHVPLLERAVAQANAKNE